MSHQKPEAGSQKSFPDNLKLPIPSPTGTLRSLQSPTLTLLLYTLLTLALTHPLIFNLTSGIPSDIGDPLLNTWILAWDSHALLTDPLNLFNANIFYPLPHTLAYSEHLLSTALLALPWQLFTAEPLAAYNLSLLLSFPLAAFGMYLLALRWTHCRRAAFIAGLIFGFNPYRFAAIAHVQLLTYHWLPFIILYLDLLLRPSPSLPALRSLPLPLFLTLQLLASWYLALYTLLITGLYLLTNFWQPHRFTRPRLLVLISSFLISFSLTLPLAWPYLSLLDDLQAARPLSQALALAAAPTDFAAAAPFNRLFGPLSQTWRSRPGFTEENTLFIGLVAPLLILFTIYHLPFTKSLTRSTLYALFLVLLISLALTFPAPYAWLAQLIPPSAIIRVPPRWIIPALFALAGLSAFGYARLTLHVQRFSFILPPSSFILCITLLLAESLSLPLPLAPVEHRAGLNPAYHWLAAQPGDLALVELPLHSAPAPEYPEVKRLYASTLGWWKLVNGYSGYTPPRQPQLAQALADFPGPNSITTLQQLAFHSSTPPTLQPSTPSLFLLIHPAEAPFDRTRWETNDRWLAERNPALQPIGQFNGDYLYLVLPPDPARFTAPPLATFGSDHSIQLLAYTLSTFQPPRQASNPQSPTPNLYLYWRSTAPLPTGYTVFIHLRAPDGSVRSQADGPPVSGHYPTNTWQPGEVIQDSYPLPNTDFDHIALGLYDPATGARLPAFDAQGRPLPNDALIIR